MTQSAFPPIRRVVTGHDEAHVAKVILDAPATNSRLGAAGNVSTLIWCTDSTPADIAVGETAEDMGARKLGTAPPANGTRVTVIDFPPGNKPSMHRTETIDYVFVLAGEIDMDMDDSTVTLKACGPFLASPAGASTSEACISAGMAAIAPASGQRTVSRSANPFPFGKSG